MSDVNATESMTAHLVARLLLRCLDVAVSHVGRLGGDGLDGAYALGGVGVGAYSG